jgi:hypothetical protein
VIKSAKEAINFFYLCLFTIAVLFFSAFYLKISSNRKIVLGTKVDASGEIAFWQEFVSENPQYYEGWMELYNLTRENGYLNKAREIDPNR